MPSFTVFTGSESGAIQTRTTERKLGEDEVLVKVTHSGLCGTDCHYKHAPMGLGHEGVGVVEDMGARVHRFQKGQRVGWGYFHETCGECQQCLSGKDVFCAQRKMYGEANHDQGSLATHGVWNETWLFAVPDALSSAAAAPLMCGGATVFTALYDFNVRPTDTVGVVGVGGLGHLAIQYANKMGCRVVVFSGTDSKKAEALSLGAHEFYALKGVTELAVPHKIDHLLVTTSAQPDWSLLFSVMNMQGAIYPLSVAGGDLVAPYMPMLAQGLRVCGSICATRATHNLMLEFSARHGVVPMMEEFPMTVEGITEAFEKLEAGKLRYRAVLAN